MSGISTVDPGGGGCETIMAIVPKKRKLKGIAASVSNRSKVNVLVIILAVIFTLFLANVILCVLILLHHARMVDWFPVLLEVTGEGYLTEITDEDLLEGQ
ncbi:hypothetical protein Q1695_006714 [Nippostrongylus brasiliensis]|nr:hypothetical protein Q1695_006714 [Nippostrongylus brasiliensis]